MLTALITLLGGATARLALGHLLDAFTKWQDNRAEIERMRLQAELEAGQHERQMASVKLQASLGVQVIQAQSVAHASTADDDAFVQAVRNTGVLTGVRWVDAWNGSIRPSLASVCVVMWVVSVASSGWRLSEWDQSVMSLALGIFLGGRVHLKGG